MMSLNSVQTFFQKIKEKNDQGMTKEKISDICFWLTHVYLYTHTQTNTYSHTYMHTPTLNSYKIMIREKWT